MNTKMAMEALLRGEKIKRPSWKEDQHIHLRGDGQICWGVDIIYDDDLCGTWEPYTAPAPKRKVMLYATIHKGVLQGDAESIFYTTDIKPSDRFIRVPEFDKEIIVEDK